MEYRSHDMEGLTKTKVYMKKARFNSYCCVVLYFYAQQSPLWFRKTELVKKEKNSYMYVVYYNYASITWPVKNKIGILVRG